ncbi:hypothetical protein [Novosphingobium sp.]|uniref:hypothetical protein n=1 Tax=Novosphingobium sp. TaxID=1874826 RepID=UPI0038BBF4FB
MDHEQRTKATNRQDPELAAKVVRSIGEIETQFFHAAGPLSERMMSEALVAIEKIVTSPWEFIENDWTPQVVCPEWKMTRGVGTGDMWLQVAEISADEDEYEHTWIAAVTKTVPSQLCVQLMFRKGLQDYAQAAIKDMKAIAPVLEKGFVRDDANLALFVPIHIPAEKLAQGFGQNDLTPTVQPFAKAMQAALAAKPVLDKLLEGIRAAAKTK